MYFLLSVQVLIFAFFEIGNCDITSCEDSEKHFSNLCFTPKPFTEVDLSWLQSQPAEGWHMILGNDLVRIHLADGLKGELLSPTDNFEDICLMSKTVARDAETKTISGEYSGYKDLTANWTCKTSVDFPGLLLCDDVNPGVTNYHENYNYYLIYTNNKTFTISIACFPNGQVGWIASSINKSFTDEEKAAIEEKIMSFGFSNDNTVALYDEAKCSGGK